MASAPTSPDAGSLGPYRLGRRLSVGGMAEVFEAHDARDGTRWAVKVPLPSASREPAYVEALEHEAALAVRLAHPNVVRGRELVRDGDRIGFVMECVDGLPLDALFEAPRATRPGAEVALVAVESLLEALAAAHTATDAEGRPLHIVHRDVKPANVFVSRSGEVKLLDFGIARSAVQSSRTRTGTIKGTLRYLTPEQATGSALDPRTDLYAVGLLAYEWVVGAPYLDASTDLELLRIAEDPPQKPLPASLGDAGRTWLGRCLARFPEDRPSHARAVIAGLARTDADRTAAREALSAWVTALAPRSTPDAADEALGHAATEHGAEPARPRADAAPAERTSSTTRRWVGLAFVASVALGTVVVLRRTDVPGTPDRPPTPASAVPSPGPSPGSRTPPRATGSDSEPLDRPARATTPPSAPTGTAPSGRVEPTGAPAAVPTRNHDPAARTGDTPRATAPRVEVATVPSPPSTPSTPTPSTESTQPQSASADTQALTVPTPTRESVRRRLAQADAAMREARTQGRDVTSLERDARLALERYAEGDYAGADRVLVSLIRALAP